MSPVERPRIEGDREQEILAATLEVLADVGYDRLTMDAVAARAGTSRPVIARRWASRAELALAALNHASPAFPDPPDTGALRTDLLALMRQTAGHLDSIQGEILSGITADTARAPSRNPASDAARTPSAVPIRLPRSRQLATILRRAAERDELPPTHLPERVATLPHDLIRNEFVLHGHPPDDAAITEIVDAILLPAIRHAAAQLQ